MKQNYQGSCHCRYVRFEVEADIDHVRVCNCSLCHKRGGLLFRVPKDALNLLTPSLDELTHYQWGSFSASDYFCPKCGILPFRQPSYPTQAEIATGSRIFTGWAVNTRCLDDFDTSKVRVHTIIRKDVPIEEVIESVEHHKGTT